MIDFSLMCQSLPSLLKGALVSLEIASASCAFGLGLGTFLGIVYASSLKGVKAPISCYVAFFRGTPMLVQIMFMYYVLPQMGVRISAEWSAILAISLNSAAYISQIVRSGISAIPVGQWEAAKALGFSEWQTIWHIILPQAFRITLPSLNNEFITLIKDSSLASIIGVVELSKEASMIRSRTYDAFSILILVALIYLAMTVTLSFVLKIYEKKAAQYV